MIQDHYSLDEAQGIANNFATRYHKEAKRTGDQWQTHCPCHIDDNGSLSLTVQNGKLLVHCQAGCDQDKVWETVKALSSVRKNNKNNKQIDKVYPYIDLSGKVVIEKVRYKNPKDFILRRLDGNGNYIYKKPTVGIDTSIIYRYPEVQKAIDAEQPIYVVEGEKDVDNLMIRKLTATCNLYGASKNGKKPKWTDKNAHWLKGAQLIIIFYDNDSAGMAHALAIAQSLNKLDIRCKIVQLPGLSNKGDVSDYFDNGGTKEQLLQLVEAAPFYDGTSATTPFSFGTSGTNGTNHETELQSKGSSSEFVPAEDALTGTDGTEKFYPYFDIRESGVYYIELAAKEIAEGIKQVRETRVCSKLEILGATRDKENKNWGRLLCHLDPENKEHTWAMPMRLLASSGDEYRATLLESGLIIDPGTDPRKLLTIYIQTQKIKRFVRCVPHSGWHGSQFIMPDGTVCGKSSEEILLQTDSPIDHGIARKGSMQGWKDTVGKYCKGNSRMLLTVSAAFAAPLLEIFGIEGFILNNKGLSSKGKTTIQGASISAYGSPKYKKSWLATKNGIEALAAAYNNLPLPLDEMKQADPRDIAEAVYMLGNGTGKQRANKFGGGRTLKQFNTLVLSTSEHSLSTYLTAAGIQTPAGAKVRCIEVSAIVGKYGVFENLHGFADGAKFSEAIIKACSENYGFVGIDYLSKVAEDKEKLPSQFDLFKQTFETLLSLQKNISGQVYRVAEKFAAIGFGGELATAYDCTGWEKGEATNAAVISFKAWLEDRGGDEEQERISLLAQVRLFFERHGESRFQKWNDEQRLIINHRAGFRKDISDNTSNFSTEFYVLKETYQQELTKDYDLKFANDVLRKEGLLIPDSEGNSTTTVRLPGGTKNTRVYVFREVYGEREVINE